MIFNGVKLLIGPKNAWSACAGQPRSAGWLLGASITAVVLPAVAVVAGHLGSAFLGFEARDIAIQRAAVGLVSAVGGALVMAPALTLVIMKTSKSAREPAWAESASPAAMGLMWPAWTAGILLAAPPLLGLGPELGEILWFLAAIIVTGRAIRLGATRGLKIRRRWAPRFFWRTELAFIALFLLILIAPAMAVRSMMGVESEATIGPIEPVEWPLPPTPNW